MIIGGLKNKKNGVVYGSRDDVCWFCATEAAIKNHEEKKTYGLTRETAGEALKGKLAGKPIFRFPISGGPYIICKDHVRQIIEEMEKLEKDHEKDSV